MSNDENPLQVNINKKKEPIRPVAIFAFLMVACMPIHTITVGGIGIFMLIGLPLFALSIPAFLNRLKYTRWDKATLLLVAYFSFNILAYLWAPEYSLNSLYNYTKIIVMVMCLYVQTYSVREKRLLLSGAVLAGLMVCWFILTGSNMGYADNRLTVSVFGVLQDPNYLGYLFLIPAAVAIQQIINQKQWTKRFLWLAIASAILLCVLLTGSRGALLGIAVVVGVCVFEKFKTFAAKIMFSVAMAIVIIALYVALLMLLPEYLASRFSIQLLLDTGGTGRLDIWMNAFRVMAEAPYRLLFGFGTGSSNDLIGWATHNVFIQLLLEGGIVSLGLFLSFLWMWSKRLYKKDTTCFAILLGCIAMAMTLSVNTVYYFWIVYIVCLVASNVKRY